jgi:hypothetical protein
VEALLKRNQDVEADSEALGTAATARARPRAATASAS